MKELLLTTVAVLVLLFCVTALLALSQEAGADTITVGDESGDDFRTIGQALDSAQDWDVIEIADGDYKENLEVRKNVALRGAGAKSTIIRPSYGHEPSIMVLDGFMVNITGLSFHSDSMDQNRGIHFVESQGKVENCVFQDAEIGLQASGVWTGGSGHTALLAANNSFVDCQTGINLCFSMDCSLQNNRFQNCNKGVDLTRAINSTLRNNSFSNSGWFAIRFWKTANISLENNYMDWTGMRFELDEFWQWEGLSIAANNTVDGKKISFYNGLHNITLPQEGGQLILFNCSEVLVEQHHYQGVGFGIGIAFCKNVTLRENRCEDTGLFGIHVLSSHSISILENDCSGNGQGIRLENSRDTLIQANDCSENTFGIKLERSVNSCVLSNNCQENRWYGIYGDEEVNDTLEGNVCTYNGREEEYAGGDGIKYSGIGCALLGNECSDNLKSGIHRGPGPMASSVDNSWQFVDNLCMGNGEHGIRLERVGWARVHNNSCYQNQEAGISLGESSSVHHCVVSNNSCLENAQGIVIMPFSSNNTITGNVLVDNNVGILQNFDDGVREDRFGNVVENNSYLGNGEDYREDVIGDCEDGLGGFGVWMLVVACVVLALRRKKN